MEGRRVETGEEKFRYGLSWEGIYLYVNSRIDLSNKGELHYECYEVIEGALKN